MYLTIHPGCHWVATPGNPSKIAVASIVKIDTCIRRVRAHVFDSRNGRVTLKLETVATLNSVYLLRIWIQFRVSVILEDVRNECSDVEDVYETIADNLAIALIVLTKERKR